MREQVRIGEVQELIVDEIYAEVAHDTEYSAGVPIYDVRDYEDGRAPGICTFGGFIGELLIVLTSVEQSILKSDQAYGFKFDAAQIGALLTEMFSEAAYPANIAAIKIPTELLSEDEQKEPLEQKAQIVAEKLLSSRNHAQFGMRFLIDTSKTEWGLVSENLIRETFIALATIHYKEAEEPVAVPEEDPENEDPKLEEKQDAAVAQNEAIEARNETLAKMKTFIGFVTPEEGEPEMQDFAAWEEKAFVRVRNFREMVMNEAGEMVEVPVIPIPAPAAPAKQTGRNSQ